ncbi:MAG: DNA gyrase subunit A, partial [Thermoplasmata archaeon]
MNNTLVRPIEEEMKVSYLDYSMSVIVGRALPDVRDGLKPVQRRILYAMHEMGLGSNKPYRKSARVVGEVLGKYHPHGDMAVYDALVRMAQEFTFRYPLIDGQGNFGSVDGDSPAAMRYTECRLSKIAEEMLHDLDKETVDYADNFDATLKEPTVLPSKFPNLLVNGCSGIAVGMSTNIPPHNLREIVDGIILLLDNPEAGDAEVMNFVKGPDFPTGGVIHGRKGIVEAYTKGRGLIKVRGRVKFEREKGKVRIVITEIPYHVNKASLVKEIADRVKDGRIIGISDLRDESDREGIRVVVEVRKGVDERVVLNQLYAHTSLQTTFGIINLALVDGRPKILSLRELLLEYIKHRKNVIRRRTEFELRKAKERAHIVEGLLTALAHIDDVITVIRRSKDAKEAQSRLMTTYLLSEKQAKAILSMQLQRLTRLEGEALAKEHEELREKIKDYEDILRREERVIKIIKEELLEIKKKYGDDRRTDIEEEEEEIEIEDLIPEQNVVVMMTNKGYIKAVALDAYKKQHRGGVGLIGMETKDEDFVVRSFVSNTHDYILF